MLPIAAADSRHTISQASTVGGWDYTGVIVSSILKNLGSASLCLPIASIAVATEFIHGIQPTVSSALSIIKQNTDDRLQVIMINHLITLKLSIPLSAIIEPDADAFIVRCPDLPVFGFADDPIDATTSLKREIESLYYELMEDDNLSAQLLGYKEFLRDKILASK
jgi:hypothetical protein